jgi:hypothetical protein
MRLFSANQIKGKKHCALHSRPARGTKLGELYDQFQANKGAPIQVDNDGRRGVRLQSLTDFYGLDIRHVSKKHYVLAGEWFGRVYIDYIEERLERESAAGQTGGLS